MRRNKRSSVSDAANVTKPKTNAARFIIDRGRALLEIVATIAVIAVCGVFLLQRSPIAGPAAASRGSQVGARPEIAPPSEAIAITDQAVRGNPRAKIALIIFSDFQCPFCRRFASDTLPGIEKEYVD